MSHSETKWSWCDGGIRESSGSGGESRSAHQAVALGYLTWVTVSDRGWCLSPCFKNNLDEVVDCIPLAYRFILDADKPGLQLHTPHMVSKLEEHKMKLVHPLVRPSLQGVDVCRGPLPWKSGKGSGQEQQRRAEAGSSTRTVLTVTKHNGRV